jgi:predicted ATPase
MKILIENGESVFLTAVFKENEHPDMLALLKHTVNEIEEKHGNILEDWTGMEDEVLPIQDIISKVAESKFLVRRNLEGVKLENERIKIADRVLEILKDMVEQSPLLIFLEDLHWADESSLFVLNYIARNIPNLRIMVVGTLRPRESGVVVSTLDEMRAEGTVTELVLKDLDKWDVAALIEEMYTRPYRPLRRQSLLPDRVFKTDRTGRRHSLGRRRFHYNRQRIYGSGFGRRRGLPPS